MHFLRIRAFFYSAPNENISSPTIDCVQVGEAFGTPYKHIPAAIPGNIAFDAYRDRVGVCNGFTGQNFLAFFKGKFIVPRLDYHVQCWPMHFPTLPNVYTDGSYKNPAHPCYGLGGAGVWWPLRNVDTHPLSPNEVDCTHHSISPDGVGLWAAVGGPRLSSTRTEIIGAIGAMINSGVAHVGSDSRNFVRMAQSILLSNKYVISISSSLVGLSAPEWVYTQPLRYLSQGRCWPSPGDASPSI